MVHAASQWCTLYACRELEVRLEEERAVRHCDKDVLTQLQLQLDRAHSRRQPRHVCTGTRLTPCAHLHRDSAALERS
jgi:hypothetical protein